METKKCSRCKEIKNLSEFGKNGFRNGVQRFMSHCRDCERKRAKEKDARHPNTKKEYYKKNKEYIDERNRQWHHNNKDSIRERKYWHGKTDAGRQANYRRNMKRRSKEWGVKYVDHNFLYILDKYNWTCAECGKWVHDVRKPLGDMTKEELSHKATADHIKPLAHGGDTVFENMQCLCLPCNGGKCGKDLSKSLDEYEDIV